MVFGSGVLPGIKFLRVIHGVPCVGVSFLLIEQPGFFLIGVEGLHGACLCDVRRDRDCHTWVGAAPGIWWTKASDAAKRPHANNDLSQNVSGAETENPRWAPQNSLLSSGYMSKAKCCLTGAFPLIALHIIELGFRLSNLYVCLKYKLICEM